MAKAHEDDRSGSRRRGVDRQAGEGGIQAEGKTRVQLDLSPKSMKLLEDMKQRMEASSYAEVIRNVLKMCDGIIQEAGQDARLVVQRPDGATTIIRLL